MRDSYNYKGRSCIKLMGGSWKMRAAGLALVAVLAMAQGMAGAASAQIGPAWVLGIPTPLEQFHSGTRAEDVRCQPNYFPVLVIKIEDGLPACVREETALALVERGWAVDPTARPEGRAHYMPDTNKTIIPGHLPRGSCGARTAYYFSSDIVNYTGFASVSSTPFMYWANQTDFVLVPGNTGKITYQINASMSNGGTSIIPLAVPKVFENANYAIFYHEITSLSELSRYPGVTISGNHFTACSVRPTGQSLCIGGYQNGNGTVEAYVVDHPGVHVIFEPPSEVLRPGLPDSNSSKLVTMVVSAESNAPRGTYHVVLWPECGGVSFLLTVGDRPYQEQR